jgi:hypothetical protein
MNAKAWFACENPLLMLQLNEIKPLLRKRRLFAVACCRRITSALTDAARKALDAAEMFADGAINRWKLYAARRAIGYPSDQWRSFAAAAARAASAYIGPGHGDTVGAAAAFAANVRAKKLGRRDKQQKLECAAQAALIRDIFGNPFHPVAFSASWRTETVVALARSMYEARDFGAMPILADALQDAGCDNEDVLNHCRDTNQVHVRGCWVVDLVLS